MLRCASSFVIAAYAKVRLKWGRISNPSPRTPCLRPFYEAVPFFTTYKTFYEVVNYDLYLLLTLCVTIINNKIHTNSTGMEKR